jgi:peroxiredoxin
MQNGVYVQDKSMKVQERIYQGTRSTTTDEQGKFSFKHRVNDYAVLVLDDSGFAQVTVEQLSGNPDVKLQPWAKVQGKLFIGAHPGTNESIHLGLAFLPYEYHPRSFAPLSLFLDAQTDAEGNFSFERVPPINVQVYHSPKVRDSKVGMIPTSQTTGFALKPGEEKQLTLGGQGRPVVGQLVVKDYEGDVNWRADVQSIELILPPTEESPDLLAQSRAFSAKMQAASEDERKQLMEQMNKSRDESIAKQRAFYATEKGREYYFRNKRYALNFAQDGSFRVEDVPGGKYRLRVDLREGGESPMRYSAPQIAHLEKEFEVPESPGGRSDEPFDLGKIELQGRKIPKVGKAAPDFAVKTVDDKTVKLSDFSGKYLLVDFWAVWCGPCVAETPHLKATYDAFKGNPRFAMLGLSLDPDIKTPREYAAKNQLGWMMGFLGDWSKTDLPAKYGVEGIPSIFLIGPDGKIIARDLRGEIVKTTVAANLAKTESASAQ